MFVWLQSFSIKFCGLTMKYPGIYSTHSWRQCPGCLFIFFLINLYSCWSSVLLFNTLLKVGYRYFQLLLLHCLFLSSVLVLISFILLSCYYIAYIYDFISIASFNTFGYLHMICLSLSLYFQPMYIFEFKASFLWTVYSWII